MASNEARPSLVGGFAPSNTLFVIGEPDKPYHLSKCVIGIGQRLQYRAVFALTGMLQSWGQTVVIRLNLSYSSFCPHAQ